MAEQTEIGRLPSLIPELYYDLIARVIPGAVLLLCTGPATIESPVDKLKGMTAGSATILLVFFLLTSYWIGILITPLASQFHGSYRYKLLCRAFLREQNAKEIRKLIDVVPVPTPRDIQSLMESLHTMRFERSKKDPSGELLKSLKEDVDNVERFMHDLLKSKNDQARLILPKMKAEIVLCDNSFVGLLGAAIFVLVFGLLHQQSPSLLWKLLPIVLGVVLSFFAARYRMNRLLIRQFTLMRLLPENELPASERGTLLLGRRRRLRCRRIRWRVMR